MAGRQPSVSRPAPAADGRPLTPYIVSRVAAEVEELRQQLRERGYLTHAIERWFALDPWSSRTFWVELATVALKAAVLLAPFATIAMVTVMLFRNGPLPAAETLILTLLYAAGWIAAAFAILVAIALAMKLRPALAIDTPRALLAISLAVAALASAALAGWWYAFDSPPAAAELLAGAALLVLFFVVATLVVSAALLSFSIYEVHRVPAVVQRPRSVPIAAAAAALVAALFLAAHAWRDERTPPPPPQIVIAPAERRVALVAVDGLTMPILQSRSDAAALFATVVPLRTIAGESAAGRWASIGTGVPTTVHGVRAIEAVRLGGGSSAIQRVSRADVLLRDAAPVLALGERIPLPPTARRRHFVWEIFAGRGVTAAAVNWWTAETGRSGALESVGQESIFGAVRGSGAAAALAVDAHAIARLRRLTGARFVTVYLPALDIILNRLALDDSARLAASVRTLEGIRSAVSSLREAGYDVILAGLPGEGQVGSGVLASTLPLAAGVASPFDVAPTLCTLLGFPASEEMPGRSLIEGALPRVPAFGPRESTRAGTHVNREYYENLKSLGYIR